MGRPLKFKDAKTLQKMIDSYFDSCWDDVSVIKKVNGEHKYTTEKKQIRPYTITGLAVHLNTNRETLLRYEKSDEFYDTIKKAKLIIHNYAEEQLFRNGQVAGPIFNLKNNWGWEDTHKIEGGDHPIKITVTDKENV